MYLNEIIHEAKKHLKKESIKIENAAISIPGRPKGRLIEFNREDQLYYLLHGGAGKKNYKYFEPIVEIEKGQKICTYIVYD